jgi:dolichol-phosphate mannosyltransferase
MAAMDPKTEPQTGGPATPPPAVSFVVPCYREEEALAALRPLLGAVPAGEIVFVDDGSDDGTPAALAALAAADERVRVVTHPRNRGVGAAMRSGVAATRGAVVVVWDADRTYPLEDAAALVAAVRAGADVAGASPFAAAGGLQGVPRRRILLSRGCTALYRLVLGRRARGLSVFTCAFRAWRGPFVRRLPWRSDGFPAAAEMLARAVLAGARVRELPSRLGGRTEGRSKMRVLPAVCGHLGVLVRLLGARLRPAGRSGPAPGGDIVV